MYRAGGCQLSIIIGSEAVTEVSASAVGGLHKFDMGSKRKL